MKRVNADAPGVTESISPDLRPRLCVTDKGVVSWRGRLPRLGDIEAQDLTEVLGEVLGSIEWVPSCSPITDADEERAICAKGEPSTVVISIGLADL